MDSREINHKWYDSFDESKMVIYLDSDDSDIAELPAKFEVCKLCDGKGKHVNPSIDRDGLTASDFDEDPDLFENYTTGMYDVECRSCQGNRVVPEVDFDKLTPETTAKVNEFIESYFSYQRECWYEREHGY